jgi:type 1 glutamine amidotransferase
LLALQLHAGPPMKVQFRNIRLKRSAPEARRKVVFLAGNPSHGYGAHEHRAGCMLLAKQLNKHMSAQLAAEVHVAKDWPGNASVLEDADAIVIYCDGGKRHMANQHLEGLDLTLKKGVGLACLHYAVETTKGESGDKFLEWMGGYFEPHWSVNPHWDAEFKTLPTHPITRGVKPFTIRDEWYFHMRFVPGMEGVTPILSAHPPAETMSRKDGGHSGNPHVRKAVANGEIQHVAWAYERPNGGRGFGFTGGHFHNNWAHDDFRTVVLNAITWVAQAEVPAGGVPSDQITEADLEENQDYPKRAPKKPAKPKPAK